MNMIQFAIAVTLASLAGATHASVMLDQQHAVFNNGLVFSSTTGYAQTFTVGQTGVLDSIDVALTRGGGIAASTYTFTVRDGIEGNSLYSANFSVLNLPTTFNRFTNFDLGALNIGVTAGDVLAIVVDGWTGVTSGGCPFCWSGSVLATDYNGGSAYMLLPASIQLSVWDLGFRTYVDVPSPVPLPAAAWLFGSALAGLGFVRKYKQREILAA